MREESSYYPPRAPAGGRARAHAAHAGHGAADGAAPRAGLPGGELLDDPAANIELGTAFLAGLLREFGDPRLAVAAYNAGPTRVRQWWSARKSDDIEAWVEQIPFDETRQYVKRVMVGWEEYRRLYADAATAGAASR